MSDFTEGDSLWTKETTHVVFSFIHIYAPGIRLNKPNYIQIKPSKQFPNTQSVP